ncbi:MAG: hypothetical protein ACK5LT_02780 [Lachnospirales bacterium]
MENEKTLKCREDLKNISQIENFITNYELKELIRDITEVSIKIIRFSDADDENLLKNFFNYYIPQYLKILNTYKSALDANVDLNAIKNLEVDTVRSSKALAEGLLKLFEDVLKNDFKDIEAEMKVFEEFLSNKGLTKNDFNL